MKKKAKTKKTVKKTKTAAAKQKAVSQSELPELIAVLTRIAERLENLESKMTTVLQQTAVRPLQQQVQAPQPQQVSNQQPSHKSHGHHHHRQLYKTVCADCSKECEVPFKPTGERPIYCKECFSKRKSSKKQPVTQPHHKTSPMHERQIKVIPKGLGRVTISEMVPVSGTKSKPAKKSRRRR